jgi:phosphoserine phosphatase
MCLAFFAGHLLELGFDDLIASRFPALPFLEPLDPADILTPRDKVRLVENMCEQYGLDVRRPAIPVSD